MKEERGVIDASLLNFKRDGKVFNSRFRKYR